MEAIGPTDQHQGVAPAPLLSLLEAETEPGLNIEEIDELAVRETRRRDAVLPPVSVYRWWARRADAVNGAIVEATESDMGSDLLVVDPFAGGGVIPLSVLSRGHRVYAQELDPWAAYGMAAMLTLPAETDLDPWIQRLEEMCATDISNAYSTTSKAGASATVSQTLRVAVSSCTNCGQTQRTFPHALVSLVERKERSNGSAYLACGFGHLFRGTLDRPHPCPECGMRTDPQQSYTNGRRVNCPNCGASDSLANRAASDGADWEVVLTQRVEGRTRELVPASPMEARQADSPQWSPKLGLGLIEAGRETSVLLRHGFDRWDSLYPNRQLAITQRLLASIIELDAPPAIENALRLAVIGTTEMAGLTSRWDRWYLKSYESGARHRFSYTTLTAEPNVWGAGRFGRGSAVLRLDAMKRAARWLRSHGVAASSVEGPIEVVSRRGSIIRTRARVALGSSVRMAIPSGAADLVLTDPPYHDDIQYSELSTPFRAWSSLPTRMSMDDVVANDSISSREYEERLAGVFAECRRVLKRSGHMIFSYANKSPSAWVAVVGALDSAGFRGSGYAIVHGENETDHAKRNGTHIRHNLLIDVVPGDAPKGRRWRPSSESRDSPEVQFLHVAGSTVHNIGSLPTDWRERLTTALAASDFLARESKSSDHS